MALPSNSAPYLIIYLSTYHPSTHTSVNIVSDADICLSIHPSISLFIHPSHLFLSQYEYSSWLDGMPGSQSLSPPLHLSPLVGLPYSIPQSPADTDVLPLVLW